MKIGLGGIKFSEELVHVSHRAVSLSDSSFADLIGRIAANRINIPFACSGAYGGEVLSSFCIAAADFSSVERLLETVPQIDGPASTASATGLARCEPLKIIRSVGTLTLFPHRRSLALLGRIVEILCQSPIVIHSLCTSISALAINVDYHLLDLAVEVLDRIIELPEDHAPFRPEFSVRQLSP
jgi:hypothetical protein